MTNQTADGQQSARRALVLQATRAVVGVEPSRGPLCSGIVWNADTVVMAAEALHGADSVKVHTASDALEAQILGSDLAVDVAVLKVHTGLAGVAAAAPSAMQLGDELLVAGRMGKEPLVRWDHARQVGPAWRSRRGGDLARLIRLAPRLDPGLEGGGVFDLEGKLCGMAVPGPRHQTLAIPSETIAPIVATILQRGRLPQPHLGVRLQPVWLDEQQRSALSRDEGTAALVVGIEAGSAAADAGLLFADLVLGVDGRPVYDGVDLKTALRRAPVGATVELALYRAGEHRVAAVQIRERPGV